MSEGNEPPERLAKQPTLHWENRVYKDRHTAVKIAGETGATFDFYKNKYSPENTGKMGIVETESGNRYIIVDSKDGDTYIVNATATGESGKPVALRRANKDYAYNPLPPIEFGKPWEVGEFTTTNIQHIILETGEVALKDRPVGYNQVDAPNPFRQYRELLSQSFPGVDFNYI